MSRVISEATQRMSGGVAFEFVSISCLFYCLRVAETPSFQGPPLQWDPELPGGSSFQAPAPSPAQVLPEASVLSGPVLTQMGASAPKISCKIKLLFVLVNENIYRIKGHVF